MIAKNRARILFATLTRHAGRWWVSVNVEASDLHRCHQHPARNRQDRGGWVGVDRGLSAFLVAADADGTEVARVRRCAQSTCRRDETTAAASEIIVA